MATDPELYEAVTNSTNLAPEPSAAVTSTAPSATTIPTTTSTTPTTTTPTITTPKTATNTTSVQCANVCPTSVLIPACYNNIANRKMAPQYHETCKCLISYKCCTECPSVQTNCQNGVEKTIRCKDDCGCETARCEPCPSHPEPTCEDGCEKIFHENDPETTCSKSVCRTVCPEVEKRTCPTCMCSEVYVNESFCQCLQEKCVKKACPPTPPPPAPKECNKIVWETDECGCKQQVYDEEHYCDEENSAAASHNCGSVCLEKTILEGKGKCGCDLVECYQKDESMLGTFDKDVCPSNSVKVIGSSPCGRPRELCLECANLKVETDCDSKCNDVVKKN